MTRAQVKLQLPVRSGNQPRTRRANVDQPMRLLVLGDFSARPAADRQPLAGRTIHRVEIDTIDDVMRKIAPHLTLALESSTVDLGFESLEDFHPDRVRKSLTEVRSLRDPALHSAGAAAADPAALDRLLESPRKEDGLRSGSLDSLIRKVMEPHVVAEISPAEKQHLASIAAESGAQMRALLHHHSFQALEAAWRGLDWLVSGLELDENLQVHILDVTREELLADVVAAQGSLEQTGLYRVLSTRSTDEEPWSMQAALYQFGSSDTDIGLLAALGIIVAATGGPLVAGADSALGGKDADAMKGWQTLRQSEVAPWIGLVSPRILLRLPYGKATDPIGSFEFEEFAGPKPVHEQFLWGPPSLAVALLIGRSFMARGWEMEPGDEREIDDLPAYTYDDNGDRELQACSEKFMDDDTWLAILAEGVMPLVSHRRRNKVTIPRFRSIANPEEALQGFGVVRD